MFVHDLVQHGHHVQAVGSRSQEAADAFAEEFGLTTAHGSYEALVNDPDVDIVYIATPHSMHADNAKLALRAGKHVLIEKPITLNAVEARAVVALAAEKGLLVMEAMWTRYLPHMVRIREILAAGILGDVRSLSANLTVVLSDDPQHRVNNLALGGGALLDLGIYPLSFAFDVLGRPESIQAFARFKDTGADAQVATLFRYPGGQVASTLSASDTRGLNTAAILGSDGRIEIDEGFAFPTSFRVLNAKDEVVETFTCTVSGRGMQFQAVEAEELLRAGKTSSDIHSAEDVVAIMETLDAVRAQIGLRYPGEQALGDA
jgi:predicted dehydrogenase